MLVASTTILLLQVTVGGVVSRTVTVKLQMALLPAVQTTLLVPMRKRVPLGGVQLTGTGPDKFVAIRL